MTLPEAARSPRRATTTTSDTLQDDNGNGAWVTILREIDFLRTAEASARYYYGVAKVSYISGVAGVGYVSDPAAGVHARAALGWDYLPSGSLVAAHELGHNWGRNHAPCGDPGNLDAEYPYPDGSIGVYGLDVETEELKPPGSSDMMGYCESKWISDYTYAGVLNYLSPPSLLVMSPASSQEVQPSLLIWGYIRDGQPMLEPAFQVNTRPRLPSRSGPYLLEALASDGSAVFAFAFSPDEIADAPGSRQNFVFAVPLQATMAPIARLRITGSGREAVLEPGPAARPSAQLGRGADGQVRLRWDARSYPMVLVRDPDTGEVLSLARGGDVRLPISKNRLDLVLSDGVRSHLTRIPVAP